MVCDTGSTDRTCEIVVDFFKEKNIPGELFRDDSRTIRYGVGENLYGYSEIASFRAARSPAGLMRKTARTAITAYGRDTAVASTLFYRDSLPGKVGRQMQTWVRCPEGWRIVAAHVSIIDEPKV